MERKQLPAPAPRPLDDRVAELEGAVRILLRDPPEPAPWSIAPELDTVVVLDSVDVLLFGVVVLACLALVVRR